MKADRLTAEQISELRGWLFKQDDSPGWAISYAFVALTELEELRAELERKDKALRDLVQKLDAVHADGRYKSVWTLSYLHGGRYDGPTYIDELAAARAALEGGK